MTFSRYNVATLALALVVAVTPQTVTAMTVATFDSLNQEQRNRFVAHLAIGTMDLLVREGKSGMAARLDALFTRDERGDYPAGGEYFFEALDKFREFRKNGDTRPLLVEHAFIMMMRENKIDVPKDIMAVTANYDPRVKAQLR